MINPGKYNKKIKIVLRTSEKDSDGFKVPNSENVILETYANVKTTSGFTLIMNDSDFEKALTNFTIRYPAITITRDMLVLFNDQYYTIEYLNNIDEANVELEIQAKLINK